MSPLESMTTSTPPALIITESPLAMIWVSPTCVIDSVIFSACLPSYQ